MTLDVAEVGEATQWLRPAKIGKAYGVKISSYLCPEIGTRLPP